jgi:hypothetical protein
LIPDDKNIVVNIDLGLLNFTVHRLVIFYLFRLFGQLFVAHPFTSPDCKPKNGILNHFGQIKCPLDITLHQMKQVSWMLRNPFAKSIVIVSCHNEDENINEVDLLFHILGVVVNYLPSKP